MSAHAQNHPASPESSSADRHRVLDVLTDYVPLDFESLRLRASFASSIRFRAALRDLMRQKAVDQIAGGRGYRAHGDKRPACFDSSVKSRSARENRERKHALAFDGADA